MAGQVYGEVARTLVRAEGHRGHNSGNAWVSWRAYRRWLASSFGTSHHLTSRVMKAALIEECYQQALELLRAVAMEQGFAASAESEHYGGIWGRDAAITCLGAYASGDSDLIDTARATLLTLADHRSDLGQIPNAVWPHKQYWDWGEASSTDASVWFLVAVGKYAETREDRPFLDSVRPALHEAWSWLRHQQANNMGLIDQVPGADWMDSSLTRAGKVLYTNVLFAWAARQLEDLGVDVGTEGSEELINRINFLFWPQPDRDLGELLSGIEYPEAADTSFPHPATQAAYRAAAKPDRSHYASHVSFGQVVDRCDVLANVLAILSGVAPPDRAERILDFVDNEGVTDPYPSRTWTQPIDPQSDPHGMFVAAADQNQAELWRNRPGHYHNGAVWPFVGGFHVMALTRRGRVERAAGALEQLARANALSKDGAWGFHEWLSVPSGEPRGAARQAWSAATYVLAYQATRF